MKKRLISLAILLALVPLQASYGFRCQGILVYEGDTKSEVLNKCGEPTGKDSREIEILKKRGEPTGKDSRQQEVMSDEKKVMSELNALYKDIITVDVWLYNLGSRQFVQLLQFENNKLVSIKTWGYGNEESKPQNCRSLGYKIAKGDTKPEVIMKCGEPNHKAQYKETQVLTRAYQNEPSYQNIPLVIYIQIDEWTYYLGSNRFSRILKFKDGVLVKVTMGEKGN
jgi:hypothetical protein